ncbi:DUF4157 domain-containing protein [Amaricoccus tamworthensis]|uniref:eCIS core domain-containing protein n=1 Tax=Amaricoccus tamworthensis TaxID=57002 RepID=UPI003C7AC0F2
MSQVHSRSAKQTASPGGPAARPKPRAAVRPVQRKEGGCSCGGGCPACQAEKRAENEADRVADDILANRPPGAVTATPPPVQAKEAGGGLTPGPVPHPGPGRPLAGPSRGFFEGRFGQDFSGVRIHDGPGAHASAMAINARAYTSGSDIVFARGEFAPGTRRGDHLLAHELTHVIQQRQGQASVQRVPADDEIGGVQYEVEDRQLSVFFEQGSFMIDAHEHTKLDRIVPPMPAVGVADVRVQGFRSRDEPGDLALQRADEVRLALLNRNRLLNVSAQGNPTSFQDRYDYRNARRADLVEDTPASTQTPCPPSAAEYHAGCPTPPTAAIDIHTAFGNATGAVSATVTALEGLRDSPRSHVSTRALVTRFFGAGADVDALISDYGILGEQISRVSRTDFGDGPVSGNGFRCGTQCNNLCDDADALTDGGSSDCDIKICQSVLEGTMQDAVITLVHEASHCTTGLGTGGTGTQDDFYVGEKTVQFLTQSERTDSADILALFVHEVNHGGPNTIQPDFVDDVSAFRRSERPKVEEALARMAKWLDSSSLTMIDVFNSVMEARTQNWSGLFGEDIYQHIHRHFSPAISLSSPAGHTDDADINSIAAVKDRITVLADHVNGNSITARPGHPTEWDGPSGGSSVLPGTEVQVDRAAIRVLDLEGLIRKLLHALMLASPHVSASLARNYVLLVDFIRRGNGVGP